MRDPNDDKAAPEAGKLRRCLKCHTSFLSEWVGNRICERCKHMTSWREGMRAHAHSVGGHR